jgi:cytochrome c553
MKKVVIGAAALALLGSFGSAFAGDAAAGKSAFMAKGCAGCHGADAKTPTNPTYPVLVGKDAAFYKEQLIGFKSGSRQSPIMQPMTAGLSEADIDNLSAYLGSLK